MVQSNQEHSFSIREVISAEMRLDKAKVMVCQVDFDQMEYEKRGRLLYVTNSSNNRALLRRFLNIAIRRNVDLLVFPELTIPSEFISELVGVSRQYDMYIIGGSHYKTKERGIVSTCPIVTPAGVCETEKINPSPFEQSSFEGAGSGAIGGEKICIFRNTKLGDFAAVVCLDYTNDELKNALGKDSLDFLIVSAFNGDSENFFFSMQSDVQHSTDGLYLLYSNCVSKMFKGDGKSALFAFMDECYKSEFRDRNCTNGVPPNKIYEFSPEKSYCVFELDLTHKKPYRGKNGYTVTNVKLLEEDKAEMEERSRFVKEIGSSESRYLYIDKYYVKPREYDEMRELIEKESVLVITGDPGIGKTYTAVQFLHYYYLQGYHPTWFFGMDKEDRDRQREHLMNFEPQAHDIVYIEDPFGRTVFENREELKTLFGNLVQKFRSCKAKLIITSRSEVFKRFEREVLSGDKLESFKKELNVRKPSYRKSDLKRMAKLYLEDYTSWRREKGLVGIIMSGIEDEKLISPLMIYNLVKNHPEKPNAEVLIDAINSARNKDLVPQFADEIRMLSYPTKILLYLVLLCGKRNIFIYREAFDKVQAALQTSSCFEGSSFVFELRGQEEHRIQRLGIHIPVYRFSHPAYEEALVRLEASDSTCHRIIEVCLSVMIEVVGRITVDVFRRFIMRYPEFLKNIIQGLDQEDYSHLTEMDKMDLARKMLLSEDDEFKSKAKKIYPIQRAIAGLYEEDGNNLFALKLRALNRRKDEISSNIDWSRVFTKKRISSLHPSLFLQCYELASAIDGSFVSNIELNLQKTDLIKKFILLPSNNERERLAEMLNATRFEGLYRELKDVIPEDVMDERISKKRYAHVLRKFVLTKEPPKGTVYVDRGAMMAMKRGAKLYPVGVVSVDGDFQSGDIVYLVNADTSITLLSLTEMPSEDIRRYMGFRSSSIYEMAGSLIATTISKPNFRDNFNIRDNSGRSRL